ncbi:MAG: hypothetical protein ACU84J_04385, partial [Gammaproteobacteria bacterium]
MSQIDFPIALTFGALTLSLAALWLPSNLSRWSWPAVLSFAVGLGLFYGFLQPVGLLPASAFGMACYFMYRPPTLLIKRLSVCLVVILASTFF